MVKDLFKEKIQDLSYEKIIITGGLGHIGSYLIRRILSENKKINLIIVDNLSSQRYPSLFNLPKNKNIVSFYDFNVTKKNIAKIAKKQSYLFICQQVLMLKKV